MSCKDQQFIKRTYLMNDTISFPPQEAREVGIEPMTHGHPATASVQERKRTRPSHLSELGND